MDIDKATSFLNVYARRNRHSFDFNALEDPSLEYFEGTIKHAKHSACGGDGVPYSAYQPSVSLSARVLFNCFYDIASGNPRYDLEILNTQLVWFAPKGVLDDHHKAVFRAPNQLRTIFGSNTDSKMFNATIAYKFTPPTLKVTPDLQGVFVVGGS